ncbi:hypothetical protein PsorP6_008137 [Peronosclerospora sorghi]|uniref:Uncharacterized protein n=1 Tax=Peronosclerospora sorghi TaxID=230839 RepID=A0ACC0W6U1_9STRA|nr:hypothetical protein PsorP6_008137 [Peronosclerospora sorghi]
MHEYYRNSSVMTKLNVKGVWSQEEHDRFLEAMKLYPKGPWKSIADHVITRSVRQVQTHAQKYQEKVSRRLRGLRKSKKNLARPEHRIDEDTMTLCKLIDCSSKKKVVRASKMSSEGGAASKLLTPLENTSAIKREYFDISPRSSDVFDSFSPLAATDLSDCINLEPVYIPTVSESLDFLIEYLSV